MPSIKIAIAVLIIIVIFLLGLGGYIYKKRADEKNIALQKQQKIQQEKKARSSYDEKLASLYHSPDLTSLRELYNLILIDKRYFESAGWDEDEVVCSENSCNMRFIRNKDRLFNYVDLTKNKEVYKPVYTENDSTYEGVIYPINMESNKRFLDKLDGMSKCNDFIAKSYKFNTLISNDRNSELEIELPSSYFNVPSQYTWATSNGVKQGNITFKTNELYMFQLFMDNFKNDLIIYKSLELFKSDMNVSVNYYCI